jgi:hypothetical protein
MAANDMSNASKNTHPEVPFAQVGSDTIAALTKLAEIFRNKFQKVQAPGLSNAPAKAKKQKTCRFIPTNPNLSHATTVSNNITKYT